ncbi:heavy metal translocating P-type ATPase metal-binding domain-containing protein [Akkermansiaceae bacterium]|jgi:Cu2+-exporting ATPase|nr:heavy metal translocating P-type ATPase metal-binding domain-containing protein [Akkermansiaceae bacterium]
MNDCTCAHCHTPFTPTPQESEFCCGGCRFVNQLLVGEGLGDFYKLQDGQAGRPVGERPFEAPKTDWLESLVSGLPGDKSQNSLKLRVSGVTCVGCVWLIERLFLAQPGAIRASVFPATAEAEFTWEAGSDAILKLAEELPRYGYVLEDPANAAPPKAESRKLIPRLGLCAAFAMNTMAFSLPRYLGMKDSFPYAGLFDLIALLSSTFTLLIGGTYFFSKAIASLKHRTIHIDVPIALGLAFAYAGSIIGWLSGEAHLIYFDFVATFTVLMLGGRYLHLAAAERAQSQLQGQSAIASDLELADGSRKSTEALALDDHFIVPPGQALPVSATLVDDDHEFSLAWMTGEPEPRIFAKGATVPAGAIPLGHTKIELIAAEAYSDSLVARLTKEEKNTTSQPGVQRVLKYYLVTIIIIGLATGIGGIIAGIPPLIALQRMISVFIVSCPCAIGVAIPLVDRRASSALAKIGVFVQNPALWQSLTKIRHLIFDKTGTLTLENPELVKSDQIDQLTDDEKSALHALTAGSLHPLSRSLFQLLASQTPHANSAKPIDKAGLGTLLEIDGQVWTLGKPGWLGRDHFDTLRTNALSCELACDGKLIETFEFRETLRPRALQSLSNLSKSHHLHILSGDQETRVASLATILGIPADQAHAGLSPDQKADLVSSLKPSLYLGDGMNDTLAFSAATLSGTPVADRSLLDRRSDFLFTCPGLSFLPTLFSMAKWRRHTVGLILAFTITYNLAGVTACVFGHMTPFAAAILMPLSSIASLLIARRGQPDSSSKEQSQPAPLVVAKTA